MRIGPRVACNGLKSVTSHRARRITQKVNTGKTRSLIERQVADSRDAIGDCDTRQTRSALKRLGADSRDAIGDCDTRQTRSPLKRLGADSRE